MEVLNQNAVMNAEVITFKRMAYRVFYEVGGNLEPNITDCGKTMLLANIINKQRENLNFLGKNDVKC